MSDRDKLRERIRQLRDRTTGRGCTEAEAMAAAAKAAELMMEHGFHTGDVEFEQAGSKTKAAKTIRLKLWSDIAHRTMTAAIISSNREGSRVDFIGRAPGPEIACYLREVCDRAIDREIAVFKTSTPYRRRRSIKTKRAMVADFTAGMVGRMRARLGQLFVDRDGAVQERKAAQAERDRRYPDSSSASAPKWQPTYHDAVEAGFDAGNRVQLAHGVGTGKATLQIEGRR